MEAPWLTPPNKADCSVRWVSYGLLFFFFFFLWGGGGGGDAENILRLFPKVQTINRTWLCFTSQAVKRTILRSSAAGNSVKMCCITRTTLQVTRVSLLWLQSTAAFNCCGFYLIQHPHPLLAWSRFIRLLFIPKIQKAISGTIFSQTMTS